jgi:hypothetical protein
MLRIVARLRRRARTIPAAQAVAGPFGVECADGVDGRWLDRIVDDHRAGQLAVDGNEDGRSAPGSERVDRGLELAGIDAVCAHQPRAADENGVALDAARNAQPGL